jgi:formamidopyrimidine-DNA glycosylase (fpg)
MPELPEVEHIARSLETLVKGRRVVSAELLRPRLVPDITAKKFAASLRDSVINFVHRRGKHILFDLDNQRTLITHLRMSGRFMLLTAERENPKFTHAIFYFGDETRLVFQDLRHFGLMKIVKTEHLHKAKELKKLAPEPFSDEFSPEYLRDRLKSSGRSLKEFLLDQTKVCGLGNIYASEAMFRARSNPAITARLLSARKTAVLFEKIREVLSEAIGHSRDLPPDPENLEGGYFSSNGDVWLVYDREKLPCPNCKTPISRIKQGGRSTFYCRRCQR